MTAEERATFTSAQVSKLVRAADGDWRGAILLGYYTGARLGDVANMRWEAIDWRNKVIRFTPSKTKKPVTIPLHRDLERELLKNAGIGKAPMFPSLAGKGTGGKHGLSGRFAAIMEKARIEGKRTQASGGRTLSSLSFHSLRHSFNSAMANAGISQEIRQKLTGHASAETNKVYTHHELEAVPRSNRSHSAPLAADKSLVTAGAILARFWVVLIDLQTVNVENVQRERYLVAFLIPAVQYA